MKMFKFSFLILLSILGIQIYAFESVITSKTIKREKECLPENGLLKGKRISTDNGKTYSSCEGFTCANGYVKNGESCTLNVTGNVICWRSTNVNFVLVCAYHPSSSGANYGDVISFFYKNETTNICSGETTANVLRKFYCPSTPTSIMLNLYPVAECRPKSSFASSSISGANGDPLLAMGHCISLF